MYDIKIGRFTKDPEAQGVVRPDDGSWQLVIDKDGFPHLYLRVKLDHEAGEPETGLLCVEDLLPEHSKIRDLMSSSFGGKLTPEEEQAAHDALATDREGSGIPCPR